MIIYIADNRNNSMVYSTILTGSYWSTRQTSLKYRIGSTAYSAISQQTVSSRIQQAYQVQEHYIMTILLSFFNIFVILAAFDYSFSAFSFLTDIYRLRCTLNFDHTKILVFSVTLSVPWAHFCFVACLINRKSDIALYKVFPTAHSLSLLSRQS